MLRFPRIRPRTLPISAFLLPVLLPANAPARWGDESWGEMVWGGGAPQVPATPVGGLVAGVVALLGFSRHSGEEDPSGGEDMDLVKKSLVAVTLLIVPTLAKASSIGESLETALVLPGGTVSLAGSLNADDADLYKFGWVGGDFDIDTNFSEADTQLFLFDSNGIGVQADDDSAGGPANHGSVLSVVGLPAGTYFLGISSFAYDPQSAGGFIFPLAPAQSGPTGPGGASPLSGWAQRSALAPIVGGYQINGLSTTAVPEPSTLALLGLGLAGLWYRGRTAR